jgi:hypothetical protein
MKARKTRKKARVGEAEDPDAGRNAYANDHNTKDPMIG